MAPEPVNVADMLLEVAVPNTSDVGCEDGATHAGCEVDWLPVSGEAARYFGPFRQALLFNPNM